MKKNMILTLVLGSLVLVQNMMELGMMALVVGMELLKQLVRSRPISFVGYSEGKFERRL